MGCKIFLDTNLIIDLLMDRNYELDAINEIITLARKEIMDLYVSESCIATTFHILYKAKMNYSITRNVKDFNFLFPSLPVMSPTNFLKEIYINDIS